MKKCIVIIPVYNPHPEITEKASFRQTLRVLHKFDTCIVTHARCSLSTYQSIAEKENRTFDIQLFESKYFESVSGYNDLCMSIEFYKRFDDYRYMLICQLDAWVFSDQLDYWCDKGFDYIGAPIYYPHNDKQFTNILFGVGNGGFSLRKISHCQKIISRSHRLPLLKPSELVRIYWYQGCYFDYFKKSPLRWLRIIPTVIIKCFGITNNIHYYIQKHLNEDLIFGQWSCRSWGCHSHIPDEYEASHFAFEVHPSMLFKKNGRLPFGCHAFMKWEYDSFWKQHININESIDE